MSNILSINSNAAEIFIINKIEQLKQERRIKQLENEYFQLKIESLSNDFIIEEKIESNKSPHYPIIRPIASVDNKLYWYTNIISNNKIFQIYGEDNKVFDHFANRRKITKISILDLTHKLDILTLQQIYTKDSIFKELFVQ